MRSNSPARRRALLAMASVCLSAILGTAQAAEPLKVVASFSILGDIVREVGGADVSVTTLVGPDGDAHGYEPTPGDARKLAEARVLIVNGLDFETWLPRLTKASGFSGQTVTASKGVKPRAFGSQGEGQGGTDRPAAHDEDVKISHHARIHASMSIGLLGASPVSTSAPDSVTSTSSSMRIPMPAKRAGTPSPARR